MLIPFLTSFCKRIVPALVIVSAIAAYRSEAGALQVGAARIDITPPADALPIPYTSIRDPVYVRAIVLDNSVTRAVLLGVDLIGIDEDLWADASKQIAARAAVPRGKYRIVGDPLPLHSNIRTGEVRTLRPIPISPPSAPS